MSRKTSEEAHREVVDEQERDMGVRNHKRAGRMSKKSHGRKARRGKKRRGGRY